MCKLLSFFCFQFKLFNLKRFLEDSLQKARIAVFRAIEHFHPHCFSLILLTLQRIRTLPDHWQAACICSSDFSRLRNPCNKGHAEPCRNHDPRSRLPALVFTYTAFARSTPNFQLSYPENKVQFNCTTIWYRSI